jgi:hypothetical protein
MGCHLHLAFLPGVQDYDRCYESEGDDYGGPHSNGVQAVNLEVFHEDLPRKRTVFSVTRQTSKSVNSPATRLSHRQRKSPAKSGTKSDNMDFVMDVWESARARASVPESSECWWSMAY